MKTQSNFAGLVNVLRILRGITTDLSPVMRAALQIMGRATEDAFAGERDPETGTAWKPLATSTAMAYVTRGRAGRGGRRTGRRRRGEHPILQVTGRLAASIEGQAGKDYAQQHTSVVYAALQALGGNAGRAHAAFIPARNFMGLSRADMTDIERAALAYTQQRVDDALRR